MGWLPEHTRTLAAGLVVLVVSSASCGNSAQDDPATLDGVQLNCASNQACVVFQGSDI